MRLSSAMAGLALAVAGWCAIGAGVPAARGAQVTADEPQYLLSATSLAEDADLDIADELAAGRWRAYHQAPLPTQTEAQPDGRRISPHDPLLPALLAGPMAVGGWLAAKLALAALAGTLAAALLWVAVRRLGVPTARAAAAVLCFSLAPPLAVYGTQVYPELVAALVVTIAIGALTGAGAPSARATATLGVAVVVLPWFSVKYAPVAAVLALVGLVRLLTGGRRDLACRLAAGLGLAGAAFAAGHLAIYDGLTPYAAGDHFVDGELSVMGASPDYWGRAIRLLGLVVDRDFGLAAWQPAWLLALPAVAALARRRPPWWPAVILTLGAGWFTATFFALTMHGWWWPGRQTVVVLPAAVLAVAWWVRDLRLTAIGVAVGAWTFAWLVAGGLTGRLTWVIDPWSTADPVHRLWRLALPDLRGPSWADAALFACWVAIAAALAVFGWKNDREETPPCVASSASVSPSRSSSSSPVVATTTAPT